MASVDAALTNKTPLHSALDAGVDVLKTRRSIIFTLYNKVVLSSDGFVFWVATGQTMTVRGVLHYASDRKQEESETYVANDAILTSEEQVTEFNLAKPTQTWITPWSVSGGDATIYIAFGQREGYLGPADLWHYRGFAVFPSLSTQVVSSPSDVPAGPIISNSLPIWLAQNSLASVYPSFLVPDNATPPYISAHVEPAGTVGVQAMPLLTGFPSPPPSPLPATLYDLTSHQLFKDRVRLSLYGLDNQTAWQFLYSLIEYSTSTDDFGFMSPPGITDEKRTQREISAIAQKKCIAFDASYYQGAANVIARRYLLKALVTTTASI